MITISQIKYLLIISNGKLLHALLSTDLCLNIFNDYKICKLNADEGQLKIVKLSTLTSCRPIRVFSHGRMCRVGCAGWDVQGGGCQ